MKSIYFLDGLGSNRYYAQRLTSALAVEGYRLIYLPLPGHPDNLVQKIESLDDLKIWFEANTPKEDFLLMGFSLGADFAAYLSQQSHYVTRLILLDGGFMTFDGFSLEQELADAQNYLRTESVKDLEKKLSQEAEMTSFWDEDLALATRYAYEKKADAYHLKLTEETILNLLAIRRDCLFVIREPHFAVPTLVLLSDSPADFLTFKQSQFEKVENKVVRSIVISDSDHQFYLEKASEIAIAVAQFCD